MALRKPAPITQADDVYAVVLIGGKGKRLRPLSTDERPKAFLSVTRDRKTMFQRTVSRSLAFARPDRIVAVANHRHLLHAKRDCPSIARENLLLEPASRNTAPAIAHAAFTIARRGTDAIMAVLPTDQYFRNEAKYIAAVRAGIAFVRTHHEAIVVLGATPTYPATGYGYIRVSGSGLRGKPVVQKVASFTEKPDERTAARYLRSGAYLWNTGAFIFRVSTILRELERYEPVIYDGLVDPSDLASAYETLPDISIDYAVMEQAKHIYCVPGSFGWCDMGNFDALREILKREGRRWIERDGKIVAIK